MPDLVIRGAERDIAVQDGIITAIGPELPAGKREIDARSLAILPGIIDVHVHFNEPGRTAWEGAATGSRAFAAAGGTLFFDMPLNSTPCTVNAQAFDEKHAALAQASVTDFALWGGIIPGNHDQLAELAGRGVIGFKAFMSDSGLPEFPRSDDLTLYEGMREAARLNLPVSVHAESEEITRGLARRMLDAGRCGVRDYLESRPVIAEIEAIERATLLAREAGAKLHIVHISSGRGIAAALGARARGTDVSIETCPHYLTFTGEDMERIGAVAKCAPPLRDDAERERLWDAVCDGSVDIIGSDHSPAPPEMKQGDTFFRIWGGIAGIQATLPSLLDRLPLDRIADLLSANPARRFRIARKGQIAVGFDADFALVDLAQSFVMDREMLLQRHRISPYVGREFKGRVVKTILRGQILPSGTPGRLVRPTLVAHALLRAASTLVSMPGGQA
jgi:allantoinase